MTGCFIVQREVFSVVRPASVIGHEIHSHHRQDNVENRRAGGHNLHPQTSP